MLKRSFIAALSIAALCFLPALSLADVGGTSGNGAFVIAQAATTAPDTTTTTVTTPSDSSTVVSVKPTFDVIADELVKLVAILGVGLLSWATVTIGAIIKKKFGVDITTALLAQEAAHRDAWQTAIRNAAAGIIQKVGTTTGFSTASIDVKNKLLADAVRAVQNKVPDAIINFKITADKIGPAILEQLPQVAPLSDAPIVVSTTVGGDAAGGPK